MPVYKLTSVFLAAFFYCISNAASATTFGFSFKGRIWSIEGSSVPDQMSIGDKVDFSFRYSSISLNTDKFRCDENNENCQEVYYYLDPNNQINEISIAYGDMKWTANASDRISLSLRNIPSRSEEVVIATRGAEEEFLFTNIGCVASNPGLIDDTSLPTSTDSFQFGPREVDTFHCFLRHTYYYDDETEVGFTIRFLMELDTLHDLNNNLASIYYVNGIRTDENSALLDAVSLKIALSDYYDGKLPVGVEVCFQHNPSAGTVSDFVEAIDQKLAELPSSDIPEPIENYLQLFYDAPNRIKDSAEEVFFEFVQRQPTESDIDAHVKEYQESALSDGKKLVIVGHSQGNFFANESYSRLSAEQQQRTRLYSVATPSHFVAGDGLHITDTRDLIWLVPSIPPAMFPNNTNTLNPFVQYYLDVWGHSFTGYYLAAEVESRRKIAENIDAVLIDLGIDTSRTTDVVVEHSDCLNIDN